MTDCDRLSIEQILGGIYTDRSVKDLARYALAVEEDLRINAHLLAQATDKLRALEIQLQEHQCALPTSISEALNSGDGVCPP